jgi:hypothetical protein
LTVRPTEGAPHHVSRSYTLQHSTLGQPPSNYPIPAEPSWNSAVFFREWPPKAANKNNNDSAVVKSLSALSDDELRQALPPNYGDSQEEIRTVCSYF